MHRNHGLVKRRVALLAGASWCTARAIAYGFLDRTNSVPVMIASIDGVLLPVLAAAHIAGAITCLWHLKRGCLVMPMAVLSGLLAAWAVIYGAGWLMHPESSYWQSALLFAPMALIVSTLLMLTPALDRDA